MQSDFWIGSEDHRIRVNEIGSDSKSTLPSLISLMQEVAWNNSANLKYSVYDLQKHGVTWVVYRMQINFIRYPHQQELVKVQSWPSGMDRLYTYRDYRVLDADNVEIVRGTSAWLVMDIKKRELVSVPQFIKDGLDFEQEIERLELDKSKLKPVSQAESEWNTEVGLFHMDLNNHVYNTYYIQWLMESMRHQINSGKKVSYLDIQFKGESKMGDKLRVQSEGIEEGVFRHQLFNADTENELIRAKTKWNEF